jgi:hypothetical protein
MRKILAVVAFGVLAGCGPDLEGACNNYIDAWTACATEAYGDDQASIDAVNASMDGVCDGYSGVKGAAAKQDADLLQCYADTINGGDCSTSDAYLATISDISSCGA